MPNDMAFGHGWGKIAIFQDLPEVHLLINQYPTCYKGKRETKGKGNKISQNTTTLLTFSCSTCHQPFCTYTNACSILSFTEILLKEGREDISPVASPQDFSVSW